MGIYSRYNETIDFYNENTTMQEIDEAVENYTEFNEACHPIEACIQICEAESMMFDTLIECDFMEAVNKNVLTESEASIAIMEADEQKSASIKEKIKKLIDGVIQWIKNAAAKAINKFMEIFKVDQKIIDKYVPLLTSQKMQGFPGIKNFEFPTKKLEFDKNVDVKNLAMDLDAVTDRIFDAVKRGNVEESESTAKELRELYNNRKEAFSKTYAFHFRKYDLWKPGSSDYQLITDVMKNGRQTISDIKTTAKETIDNLNKIKNESLKATWSNIKDEYKSALKTRSAETDEEKNQYANDTLISAAKATGNSLLYGIVSLGTKIMAERFNALVNLGARQIASCRKALLICGNYAAKDDYKKPAAKQLTDSSPKQLQLTGESTMDDLFNFIVCESSDQFIAEHFGY